MDLRDALESGSATKHVEQPIAGTHVVDSANLSVGYYHDFKADDPAQRTDFNTSMYYGYGYPGADPLASIASFAGSDGWQSK